MGSKNVIASLEGKRLREREREREIKRKMKKREREALRETCVNERERHVINNAKAILASCES